MQIVRADDANLAGKIYILYILCLILSCERIYLSSPVFPKLCAAAYWCAADEAEACRECFDKTFCMLHHFRYKVCEE